jgi:hypothetical protein
MKQPQPHPEIKDRRAQSRPDNPNLGNVVRVISKQESDRISMQLLANYQAAHQTESL